MQTTLHSNSTGSVFHFIADNSTAQVVLPILRANCDLNTDASSAVLFAYTGTNASDASPVDAVQYFRASSAVLTLEGYNNTAALSSTLNLSAFPPLPTDTDTTLLACLNTTIGASIPLVDAPLKFHWGSLGIFLLVLAGCAGLALIVVLACCCCCASHRRKMRRQNAFEEKAAGAGSINTPSAGGDGWGYEKLYPLTKERA